MAAVANGSESDTLATLEEKEVTAFGIGTLVGWKDGGRGGPKTASSTSSSTAHIQAPSRESVSFKLTEESTKDGGGTSSRSSSSSSSMEQIQAPSGLSACMNAPWNWNPSGSESITSSSLTS